MDIKRNRIVGDKKQQVLLTGASGSMGYESFKLLWETRHSYKLVLLLRPSAKNKKLFKPFEKACGIRSISGRGVTEAGGLKIVWGDVMNKEDVVEACKGIDYCLHTLALISPEADRNPELAMKVNYGGTKNLVEAIEAEGPESIRFVNIASVALYGDRLPPVHRGRTGDPVVPSVYDHYALSKIRAEKLLMQSKIRHRVSLRQTFIMIPDLFSLKDPIMFHQPINSCMENITARDSGRLMLNCLEVPDSSEFWGGYYNISGGPACRTSFLEFLKSIYGILGLRHEKVMERRWFALQNFHMVFYEDSGRLDDFLHHWEGGQSQEDYYSEVENKLPGVLKMTAWLCKRVPFFRTLVERITYKELSSLAEQEEGSMHWVKTGDRGRIDAFYRSQEAFESIPDWGVDMPKTDQHLHPEKLTEIVLLDHGYDESQEVLSQEDLQKAATFRGGKLSSEHWKGDMHEKLHWVCARGHGFELTAHAMLKGGHWCQECISPPWNYRQLAGENPFAAQVLQRYL